MHDDVQKLWMLLQIHKELIGHPKLVNLKKQIDDELNRMNVGPEKQESDKPVPVYPKDSGVVETDPGVDATSDPGIMRRV